MRETIDLIKELITRDLDKLKNEIESYKDESNLWELSGEITNSSGNLCLHICGNLKCFIGADIGKTGYVRKRDDEFNLKNVSRGELLKNISETKQVVSSTLDDMNPELMNESSAVERLGKPLTNHSFLIYLVAHLNYHLGQINYNRRLIDGKS